MENQMNINMLPIMRFMKTIAPAIPIQAVQGL
jgi:hypothetical protein